VISKCFRIFVTPEYIEWLQGQSMKDQYQIEHRIKLIELEGYFGDHKSVSNDDTVWELKWKGGRRIYYAYVPEQNILLLLGGNKNGQNKDINKAKNIFTKRQKIKN
jgi:putative addiction module killer protein